MLNPRIFELGPKLIEPKPRSANTRRLGRRQNSHRQKPGFYETKLAELAPNWEDKLAADPKLFLEIWDKIDRAGDQGG